MLSTISSSTDAATSCRLQNCLNGDNAVPREEVPSGFALASFGALLRIRGALKNEANVDRSEHCGHYDPVPLTSSKQLDAAAYG